MILELERARVVLGVSGMGVEEGGWVKRISDVDEERSEGVPAGVGNQF